MTCPMQQTLESSTETTFVKRFLVPGVALICLLFAMAFFVILPLMQTHLEDRKKEDTKAVVSIAWTVLQHYHTLETNGTLTREQAQEQAKKVLQDMRYGAEMKDYIWINDMNNVMLMHPYMKDLVGKDVSEMTDSHGKFLFIDFLHTVSNNSEGHVTYHWPLYDDKTNIDKKISFVKAFKPWDWYIGSGVYLHDALSKTYMFMGSRTWIFIALLLMATLLGVYIIMQGKLFAKLTHAFGGNIKEFFNSMSGPVICIKNGGRLCWFNSKAANLCGLTKDAIAREQKVSELCCWYEDVDKQNFIEAYSKMCDGDSSREDGSAAFTAKMRTVNDQLVLVRLRLYSRSCRISGNNGVTMMGEILDARL